MKTPGLEVPPEMRAFAEKSVEEAKKAFETYMDAANRAISTAESSTATCRKALASSGARRSVSPGQRGCALAFAEEAGARPRTRRSDRCKAEFAKAQMQALAEQAKALGNTAAKTRHGCGKAAPLKAFPPARVRRNIYVALHIVSARWMHKAPEARQAPPPGACSKARIRGWVMIDIDSKKPGKTPKFEIPSSTCRRSRCPGVSRHGGEGVQQAKDAYARMKTAAEEANHLVETPTRPQTRVPPSSIQGARCVARQHERGLHYTRSSGREDARSWSSSRDHTRKQFEALAAQTKDLSVLAQKVATETAEPIKAGRAQELQGH